MGDAQIFCRSSAFLLDMAAFWTKFMRDIVDAQRPGGAYTDVCPYLDEELLPPVGAPAWADAGIVIPWTVYCVYGDSRILERNYASMARFLDFVAGNNPDGIWRNQRGNDYGDWVPAGEESDKTMLATLYFHQSAAILAKAASVLGKDENVERFAALASKIRDAFNAAYLKDGKYRNSTQAINAIALETRIVPENARNSVTADLIDNIASRGTHLTTGFLGTKSLMNVLSETGHGDTARRLLLNRDFPSWGYMIEKGATTIWERWNGDTGDPAMNSYNHFAYGCVVEWMFRYLAGIDTADDAPGYERIVVKPEPCDGEINRVSAWYESVRGRIACEWESTPDEIRVKVSIPANTEAEIHLPADDVAAVSESGAAAAKAEGIRSARAAAGRVLCRTGSGNYAFVIRR